jgi:hypothetical protein
VWDLRNRDAPDWLTTDQIQQFQPLRRDDVPILLTCHATLKSSRTHASSSGNNERSAAGKKSENEQTNRIPKTDTSCVNGGRIQLSHITYSGASPRSLRSHSVAQALLEGVPILSGDHKIAQYPVQVYGEKLRFGGPNLDAFCYNEVSG